MQRDLITPEAYGFIRTIAPGSLTVHSVFDREVGLFKVSAVSMQIREGEVAGSGPYEFLGKRGKTIELPADKIPAGLLMQLQTLLGKGLELHAAQKGYELEPAARKGRQP